MIEDERYAELYMPGGQPYFDEELYPVLADFECGECGLIGAHEPGCSHNFYVMEEQTMDDNVPCKIDGCDQAAVQRKGKYGLLCAEHRRERQLANGNGNGVVMALDLVDDDLPEALRAEIAVTVDDQPAVWELVDAAREVAEAADAVENARQLLALRLERLRELTGKVAA